MMGSCGAFCSFCGRCGRRIAKELGSIKPPDVAPPGISDKNFHETELNEPLSLKLLSSDKTNDKICDQRM